MAAVEAVAALPSIEEINGLVSASDQVAAAIRAQEITDLLKAARELYSNIVSETQIGFFEGSYDGVNYLQELTRKEMAMRPVKDHFGIITSVISITLITTPDKMSYVEGEKIDTTGMVVQATFDDGTKQIVEDYTLSTYEATLTGGRITVFYGGQTTSFRVSVSPKEYDDPVDPDSSSSDSSSDSESTLDSGSTGKKKGCGGGCKSVVGGEVALVGIGFAVWMLSKKKKDGDEE